MYNTRRTYYKRCRIKITALYLWPIFTILLKEMWLLKKKIFFPRIWQSILLIAAGVGFQLVAGLIIGVLVIATGSKIDDSMIAALVASPFCTLLAALLGIYLSKVPFKKYIENKLDSKIKLLYCFLLFLGAYFISLLVGGLLETFIPSNDSLNSVFIQGFNSWIGIVAIVILAPICEELLFRGVILRGFLKNYGPATSVIMTAVLFGVFHFNPIQSVTAGILGLALGWMFVKTGSLWICILFHALYNGFSTLLYFISSNGNIGDMTMILIMIPAIILGGISAFLLARKPGNIQHILEERDEGLRQRADYESQQYAFQAAYAQNNPYAYQTPLYAGNNMGQYYYGQQNYPIPQAPAKNSGLGIASFVISLVILVFEAVGIILMTASQSSPGYQVMSIIMIYGAGVFGSLGNLTGIGLGIGGACQKKSKKALSIIGIILNSITILAFVFFIIISGSYLHNIYSPGNSPFAPGSNPFPSGGIDI